MNPKCYFYRAADGVHFPDGYTGEVRIFELDFAPVLDEIPNSLLRAVTWEVSPELVRYNDQLVEDRYASIKLGLPFAGSYGIKAMASIESPAGLEQRAVPMRIRVF